MWKGNDYLEKFRKKYKGGPKELAFEELGFESKGCGEVPREDL
jgi:hypothetical protein